MYIKSTEDDAEAVTISTAPVAYPEQDCGEYKSEIWDDAFSNPKTMQLAHEILKTAEDMAVDPVCVDTTRAVMNYFYVKITNQNAHYVEVMLFKLLKTIAKQAAFNDSDQAGETRKLIHRVIEFPKIRNLITKTVARTAELLQDPKNRVRVVKMVLAVLKMLKPTKEEKMVKQTIQSVKKVFASPMKKLLG